MAGLVPTSGSVHRILRPRFLIGRQLPVCFALLVARSKFFCYGRECWRVAKKAINPHEFRWRQPIRWSWHCGPLLEWQWPSSSVSQYLEALSLFASLPQLRNSSRADNRRGPAQLLRHRSDQGRNIPCMVQKASRYAFWLLRLALLTSVKVASAKMEKWHDTHFASGRPVLRLLSWHPMVQRWLTERDKLVHDPFLQMQSKPCSFSLKKEPPGY